MDGDRKRVPRGFLDSNEPVHRCACGCGERVQLPTHTVTGLHYIARPFGVHYDRFLAMRDAATVRPAPPPLVCVECFATDRPLPREHPDALPAVSVHKPVGGKGPYICTECSAEHYTHAGERRLDPVAPRFDQAAAKRLARERRERWADVERRFKERFGAGAYVDCAVLRITEREREQTGV